ncbi:electron transport complex subunit RsxG [Candidatus Venteria ishoeyi]|uniref:Ion-translocating oxidoreductase complex subunit G n=1 Tax=Candidatus Venteria ishoeyi TaxID=1899563 RepID=A0A1H6F4Z6_9GAMM|nr:electron transport complex subunit RsxG [Candidatus Venteria ishoeyi]SEH05210.1 Electron transport complex protein RnfG [Candidatus Venteria ishoeyi]
MNQKQEVSALKNAARGGIVLLIFAVFGTLLVALTYEGTREKIQNNERAALLNKLHQLLPPELHDNDLLIDTLEIQHPVLLGTSDPITVYRARKAGQPVALAFMPVAPDGYNGNIRLLVGIDYAGTLLGVRVISHQETPGLGDDVDERKSDWITRFQGHSLHNPEEDRWQVKRDGGVFDQFTGATITPRAVVRAVLKSLKYYEKYREQLFEVHSNETS